MAATKIKKSVDKSPYFAIGAILLVFAIVFLALDLPERSKFSYVFNDAQSIKEEVSAFPDTIEERWYGTGNGFIDSLNCLPDEQCPYAGGAWVVPMEPGREGEIITKVLKDAGYSVHTVNPCDVKTSCTLVGTKITSKAYVHVVRRSGNDFTKTDDAGAGKAWRRVDVRVKLD